MSFARNFAAGQQIAQTALNAFDTARQKRDMGRIVDAKPEESQGFTAEQGAELEAAVKRGEQVAVQYKDDGQGNQVFDRYVVTPKMPDGQAGPPQQREVAMQGVTDFLGNRTAGTMSDGQVSSARQRALAGVIMKTDPVRGAQMVRDVTRDERDDKRFAFEDARNQRQQRLDTETDADKAFMKQLDTEVGDWFKTKTANPDGTQRAATYDDHLAASQYRAGRLLAGGKTDAAGQVMKDYNAQSLVKIQMEGAQRNEALGKTAAALATGDLDAVRDFYNQYIPDGARVLDVQKGPKGEIVIQRERLDGTPMPPTTMKDTGQLLAALSSFKDPMAVYSWSQNEFANNLKLNAEQRAVRADARAGVAAGRTASNDTQANKDKQDRVAANVALFKERNPNATAAELEAVRVGTLDAIPKAQAITSDFKPDGLGSSGASGTLTQKDKDGNVIITKIDSKGQPGKPVVISPPGRAAATQPATGAPRPLAKPATAADIAATAKKYNISEDEVRSRLGLK